jgi:pimeloyl-ACP methyl ester carboxylesterase
MKNIYCISGFGADERVFSKLVLTGYDVHFIKWIIPAKNESICEYAKRLTLQIHHSNPILIGISFGGMMGIEISKLIPVEKIIIISSIKTFRELPLWMRLSGKLKLNRMLPMKPFKILDPLENYNLGAETNEEKKLLREYRRNINQQYCDWAINTILNWKNVYVPKNIFHIHGSNDRIFPLKNLKPDYIINGGHLIAMNRPKAVNEYLDKILNHDKIYV